MTPTLILGRNGAPSLELEHPVLNTLAALLVERHRPLDREDGENLYFFLNMDTLFLSARTQSLFRKIEDICRRVAAGELTRFDVAVFESQELKGNLKGRAEAGVVTAEAKAAAQGLLDFLAEHPGHWPLPPAAGDWDGAG